MTDKPEESNDAQPTTPRQQATSTRTPRTAIASPDAPEPSRPPIKQDVRRANAHTVEAPPMLLRTLIHTLLIWGIWFVASALLRDTDAPALRLLESTLSIYGGIVFAAAAAISLNNAKAGAVPLVVAVLLAAYPFSDMTALAATLAPVGIGLLVGTAARGLIERPEGMPAPKDPA